MSVSKQLNGWIESLKNSDIKGVRYLNDRGRAKIQRNKEDEEFDREIKLIVEKAAKERGRTQAKPILTSRKFDSGSYQISDIKLKVPISGKSVR